MQKFASHRSLLLSAFLLCCVCCGTSAFSAERKEQKAQLPKPPPQPVGQVVRVPRAGKVEIPLKIYGSQREVLRFLIRAEPSHGKLSTPRPTGRERASVTYEPPDDLSVKRDQFTYAVQNSAGVSAGVDVRIEIEDAPAVLAIPHSLEFPVILAGTTASQEFEIANRGGGVTEGEIQVDAPWRIEGDAAYRLKGGESRQVRLVFAPTSGGPFRGEVRFTSERSHVTALRGEAHAALGAEPASVMLRNELPSPVRIASTELVNHTASEQRVRLSASPRLHVSEEVVVPANGRALVTVQSAEGDVAPIEEEIRAEGAGVTFRISVHGGPVGPILRSNQRAVTFGVLTAGYPGEAILELENVGGKEGYWKWEAMPPFVPDEPGAKIWPGEKRKVTLRVPHPEPGSYRNWLKITGEQSTLEIPVEAEVTAQTAATVANTSTSATRGGSGAVPIRTASRSPSSRRPASRTPKQAQGTPLARPEVVEIHHNRAVVAWPQGNSVKAPLRLELRSLTHNKQAREFKVDWREYSGGQFRTEGDRLVVEIGNLAPASSYVFRPVPRDPSAVMPIVLAPVQLQTPPKPPFLRITTLRVLLFLLVLCGGAIAWKRYQRT